MYEKIFVCCRPVSTINLLKLRANLKANIFLVHIMDQRNDGNMLDSEHPPVFLRCRHEEAGKRLNDPARKRVQHFMRIEGKIIVLKNTCNVHQNGSINVHVIILF